MKKTFYLLNVLCITFLFFGNLNAQTHCAQASGPSNCTADQSLTVVGFYPPDTALACAIVGVPYDTIIQFHVPATAQGYTINWIKILNIYNLPCGLCWRSGVASDQINGNTTACVRVTGTTYDAPGEYKIAPFADVNVAIIPPFVNTTLANVNIDSVMGLKYYARVRLPNTTCVQVDTLDPGLTAHTMGTAPAISLTGATGVCTGGSSTFSISNAGSYYAYQWSTGAVTSSINVSTGGTYTVTAYAACASATASRTLTINSNPTPTITPSGPTTFCSGSSVTLDPGTYSGYLWSTNATSPTITVSQSGTYTVTVTQNGCTGTSNTITVTVNNNPVPTITPGSATTFCEGGSVTLDAGAGYDTYTWSTAETTQSINVAQSDNVGVTVTQNGCSGSSAITVTENSNPTPVVNASGPTTFCAGGSVTLDAGPGYSSYTWSGGAGTGQTLNVTQGGTYDVTVQQNGCSGVSNSVGVTVNPIPTPVITAWGPTSFCVGGDVWLNAPAGYDTYLWSDDGVTTASYTATETGSYNVTVTQNGCSGTSNSIDVTVTDPLATINANGPTTFCTGGSVTLDAGPGFASYAWSDLTNAQTTVITQSGSYNVTTTLNGCTATSAPVVVTVSGSTLSPVITADPSFNICPGGSAVLDAGVGYDTYSWSTLSTNQTITESTAATYMVTVTQGTCSGTASATLNVGNFPVAVNISPAGPVSACTGDVVTLDAGGAYDTYAWSNLDITSTTNVTTSGSYVVVVTSNSCVGTDTVDVTFNSALQPAISPQSPINACTGDVVTLDAGVFATYSWSSGAQTQTIQPLASGSYSVTVTQNGCSGSDTVDVIFNAHPVVSISPAGPVTGCEGDVVTLDAGAGYTSYSWSNGDGTQTAQFTSSSTAVVTVMQNGCAGTDTVEITLNALPQPAVTPAGPVSACVGDNVILDAGSGYTSYSWSTGDLAQTTQPTASGSIIVNVTQNGCTAADTVEVTFNAIPHAAISPSGTQTICSGQSVTLDAGAGFSSYQWTNTATSQAIAVDSAGTYDVTVTANGCSGSSTNPVNVLVNLTPNATITEVSTAGWQAVLQASPANATYQWLFQLTPNDPYTVEQTTGALDTVTCGDVGEYHTVVVTQNGCTDTSSTYTVVCVGINHLAEEVKFSLMPNPANDVLNVSYDLNKTTSVAVSIVDLTGRKIMNVLSEVQNAGKHYQSIRLNDLASGIYLLNLTTEFGSLNTRFVKE